MIVFFTHNEKRSQAQNLGRVNKRAKKKNNREDKENELKYN